MFSAVHFHDSDYSSSVLKIDFAIMGSQANQSVDFLFNQLITGEKKAFIRVGGKYQAEIPQCADCSSSENITSEIDEGTLLWSPSTEANFSENQVDSYLENARSAALKTSCNNLEHALHVLHHAKGDINEATKMLTSSSAPELPAGHPMLEYTYPACEVWSKEESERLYEALCVNNKEFHQVSKDIHTKSVKQCVQFYYVWKKQYPNKYRSAYLGKRRKEAEPVVGNPHKTRGNSKRAVVATEQTVTTFAVEAEEIRDKYRSVHIGKPRYQVQPTVGNPHKTRCITLAAEQKVTKLAAETEKIRGKHASSPLHENISQPLHGSCAPPFSKHRGEEQVTCVNTSGTNVINKRAATSQQNSFECFSSKRSPQSHLKKHQRKSKPSHCTLTENKLNDNTPIPSAMNEQSRETVFPCAQCDRVFLKIKSRNAHMKSHKRA